MIWLILFWASFFLIVYPVVIYPLILVCINLFCSKSRSYIEKNNVTDPFKMGNKVEILEFKSACLSISIIVPFFNEINEINKKIENFKTLDYPAEKLELIFVNDGYEKFKNRDIPENNIKFIKLKKKYGKSIALYKGALKSSGEILVFTDINTFFFKDTLKKIIEKFSDETTAVSGKLVYTNKSTEKKYWTLESLLKKIETKCFYPAGFNGSIMAVRKMYYLTYPNYIFCDFSFPIAAVLDNCNVVYSPDIKVEEPYVEKGYHEIFLRKSRIVHRAVWGLYKVSKFHSFFKNNKLLFQVISHKILRWFSFLLFAAVFISNYKLASSKLVYIYLFYIQIILYAVVTLNIVLNLFKKIDIPFLKLPSYFFICSFAGITGILRFLIFKKLEVWTPSDKL